MTNFMKSLSTSVIVVLAGFGIAGLHVHYNDLTDPKVSASEMFQSSVQIGNYCSGTVINDPDVSDGIQTTILTAKHCVEKIGQEVTVTIPEYLQDRISTKKDFKFSVVDISDKSDLAILQGTSAEWTVPAVPVYGGIISFGEEVISVSFPEATSKTVTSGFLGWIEKIPPFGDVSDSQEFRRSSTLVTGGSSGGSLYKIVGNHVELVGVLTGGMGTAQWITYWTPLEEIQDYLSTVKIGEETEV